MGHARFSIAQWQNQGFSPSSPGFESRRYRIVSKELLRITPPTKKITTQLGSDYPRSGQSGRFQPRDPRFEPQHRQNYLFIRLNKIYTYVNSMEKKRQNKSPIYQVEGNRSAGAYLSSIVVLSLCTSFLKGLCFLITVKMQMQLSCCRRKDEICFEAKCTS